MLESSFVAEVKSDLMG
ncbi:hypothetical protein RHAA1_08083 [Aggregatibacter actinomycetemcomitans RhAA1]|nr:hypothetical protein RHAA1_08083 [Aggregatibacter actinomycetemcomitans RhAA1]